MQDSQLSGGGASSEILGACSEKSDLESTVPVWLVCPTAKGDSDSDTQVSTPKTPPPAGPGREAPAGPPRVLTGVAHPSLAVAPTPSHTGCAGRVSAARLPRGGLGAAPCPAACPPGSRPSRSGTRSGLPLACPRLRTLRGCGWTLGRRVRQIMCLSRVCPATRVHRVLPRRPAWYHDPDSPFHSGHVSRREATRQLLASYQLDMAAPPPPRGFGRVGSEHGYGSRPCQPAQGRVWPGARRACTGQRYLEH